MGYSTTEQQAMQLATEVANSLGPDWEPHVWQNMGWHSKAVSKCGRWKVHPNVYPGDRTFYCAFLGKADSPGGYWAENGKTPQEAVKNTLQKAVDELNHISGFLTDIPATQAP